MVVLIENEARPLRKHCTDENCLHQIRQAEIGIFESIPYLYILLNIEHGRIMT